MKNQLSNKTRGLITITFTLIMGLIIAWEYFYENGVATHYLLHSKDMPGFSNWWGLVLIPIFSWVATGFIKPKTVNNKERYRSIFLGFLTLFFFGFALSYAFLMKSDMTLYLTGALLVSAFLTPVHRVECLLGYVMSMIFVFGAIIPLLFGILFWLLFQLIHKGKIKLKQIIITNSYNSGT